MRGERDQGKQLIIALERSAQKEREGLSLAIRPARLSINLRLQAPEETGVWFFLSVKKYSVRILDQEEKGKSFFFQEVCSLEAYAHIVLSINITASSPLCPP